jgi:predicted Ser/Thr protein kinase
MDQMIGREIDSYKILEVLGRGGMGVVYKAVDTTLDRDVAIKMMDVLIAADPNFLKRFQSEAKALAKLQNSNIVSIFALRQTDFGVCIVMEYVKGKTLADVLKQSVLLPIPRVIHIFRQLLTALDHAHKGGVIHRDIKPGNVMLADGDVVKVTDFGLAKIQKGAVSTMTMGTAGTLYYMSPEQIRGLGQVDHRGDIYSAGMALYECLAGRVPFKNEDSDFAIAQMIVEGRIPTPDKFNASLPKDLIRIVMKSIDKDPAKRYQNAAEMAAALVHFGATMKPGEYRIADAPTIVSAVGTPALPSKIARKPLPVKLYGAIAGGAVVLLVTYFLLRPVLFPDEGTLTVRTNPTGGVVYVDKVMATKTPVENYSLPAGARLLSVTWDGGSSRRDTTVMIEHGKLITVTLTRRTAVEPKKTVPENQTGPEPGPTTTQQNPPKGTETPPKEIATGTLELEAVPDGEVRVDDGDFRNAGGGTRVNVEPGARTVTFKSRNGVTARRQIHVAAGQMHRAKCWFNGEINVLTPPVGGKNINAIVFVDGVKQTRGGDDLYTPARLNLPAGRYRVKVTKFGYDAEPGEQVVTLEPSFDEPPTARVTFKLKKR